MNVYLYKRTSSDLYFSVAGVSLEEVVEWFKTTPEYTSGSRLREIKLDREALTFCDPAIVEAAKPKIPPVVAAPAPTV